MTKYFAFFLLMGCWLNTRAQSKTNNFYIVDIDTKKPIPFVSVSLVRANLAINTEKDGLLTIPGDLATFRDTVYISAQNYLTIRTALRSLNGLDTIRLRKSGHSAPIVNPSTTGRDSVLNRFKYTDVSYFAGVHTENSRFNYLQLAQEFDVPVAGASLKSLFICRLAHHHLIRAIITDDGTIIEKQEKYVGLEETWFKLRFYDMDPKTNGPGRDICTAIVEVHNNNDQNLTIDLRDYNIVVPGKKFFVAIEWLRTFANAGYAGNRSEHNLIYKPSPGILPYQTNKLHIWGLNYAHRWVPYTYYSPDWTDLAISATMKW